MTSVGNSDSRTSAEHASCCGKVSNAARLTDGHVWMAMLDHRNLLSHTYDQAVFSEAVEVITTRYLPAILELHDFFAERIGE